jgi:hypothetical protein
MKIKHQWTGRKRGGQVLKILFFLSVFLFIVAIRPGKAQENDSLKDSVAAAADASGDAGPSLSNKTFTALNDEVAKIKEKERRNEILSYVYMGVGFSIVIAIAWFTTSLARKRQKKADEQRAMRLANMKHKPHHHPRR